MNNSQSKQAQAKWLGVIAAVLALIICVTAIAVYAVSPSEELKTAPAEARQLQFETHPTLPANVVLQFGEGNTAYVSGSVIAVFGDGADSEVIYSHNDNGGVGVEIHSSHTGNTNQKNTEPDADNDTSRTDHLFYEAEAVVKKVAAAVEGKSDYDKVKYFHDYVCAHTVYDNENVDNGIVTDEASSAYGALVKGVAVCSGYAKAFALLCDAADIDVYYVTGPTEDAYHAWNTVKVDGVWYQIDLTWDDREDGLIYDYFLVTDEYMAQSRDWDKNKIPACTSDKYLWAVYPTANTLTEMESIVAEAFRAEKTTVILRTTFEINMNSNQVDFLYDYDQNGNGIYEYFNPVHVGGYYLVTIVL